LKGETKYTRKKGERGGESKNEVKGKRGNRTDGGKKEEEKK